MKEIPITWELSDDQLRAEHALEELKEYSEAKAAEYNDDDIIWVPIRYECKGVK